MLEKNDITCRARDILNYKTPYLIAQNVEKATKVSYDATEGEVDLLPIQSYFFDKLNNNYSVLFDYLTPCLYQYNDGTSNRYDTGFVAQEVE